MEVSRVIEAKNVTAIYMGWSNNLKLTVEGGQLNIEMDESSLRSLATIINDKIAEQDEEKAEAARERASEKEEEKEYTD